MLVPLRWLADYVALPERTQELVERLTRGGLECNSVRVLGIPVPEAIRVKADEAGLVWEPDKVVIGQVREITRHPDADKLKLVTLDYGPAEPKTVVTGATNIAPGQSGMKVILGLQGTRYFYTDKDGSKKVFTLEPKALRGIMNDAMCMSDFELGISDEHAGIIILDDDDPAPGTPVQDVLGDVILDLDVLPNMARCLGLLGIAREVAALCGGMVNEPDLTYPTAKDAATDKVAVEIADPQLCPRYSATIIRKVTVGPAPRWMRSRLQNAGMRPINNVVDVTNYVMLEYGQPLHAFDYDVLVKRAGGKTPTIIVRPAKPGEKLTTLDGQVRELSPENLLIADTAGPIALAGVMGGAETEVTEATKTILLEAANFDPVSVRKTARQFTLFSEASTRFSRGIHPEIVTAAARRAAQLFHRHAGGEVLAGWVDAYPAPRANQTFELRKSEIERLLGVSMPEGEVERILRALSFEIGESLWGWTVTVPPNRVDIQSGAADVIEELARVSGYDRLPERLLSQELPPQSGNPSLEAEERIRDTLVDAGLQEVITYSLSSLKEEAKLFPGREDELHANSFVTIVNPVSPERSVMRRSLLPGLLEVARQNRGAESVALFELGVVFHADGKNALPDEPRRLAIVLCGRRHPSAWDDPLGGKQPQFDFFDMKGILTGLLGGLHIQAVSTVHAPDVSFLHPARAARLRVQEKALATFGELHPRTAAAFELGDRPVLVAEVDVEALLSAIPPRFAYRPLSPYTPFLRDIAVIVPDDVPAERVEAELVGGGGELLESVRLFDVYRGESIPSGTKSLAYALAYRVADRSLTDKEVDKAHQKIEGRLRHMLKAQIRGKDGV